MKYKIYEIVEININGIIGIEAKIVSKNKSLENTKYIVVYKKYNELTASYKITPLLSELSLRELYSEVEILGNRLYKMQEECLDYSEEYLKVKEQFEIIEKKIFDYFIVYELRESELRYEQEWSWVVKIIKIIKQILSFNTLYN